ncbi:hypothetical protein [Streptomyces sp. NBC_01622]
MTNGLDCLPASILTPGAPRQFRKGVPDRDFVGRDALVEDAEKGVPR